MTFDLTFNKNNVLKNTDKKTEGHNELKSKNNKTKTRVIGTSKKFRECYGKTPMQTFLDNKKLAVEKNNEILYLEHISDSHNLTDNQV